jgi:hypothetical protein
MNTLMLCRDEKLKLSRKREASDLGLLTSRATMLPSMPLSTKLCSYAV